MNILLVGRGGREHALAYKLNQSSQLSQLYIWPDHPARVGTPLDLPADADDGTLVAMAKDLAIDLVVVGPEAPLAAGLADLLVEAGIACFGPNQKAAQLESSKAFAKDVMQSAGIPTATHDVASTEGECRALAEKQLVQGGVVLKASGLASGKGVFVCTTQDDVDQALAHLYHGPMSKAAEQVVVEERLVGREASYFVFLGPELQVPLGFAVDFKRLQDGDQGPNTGGMGAYAPVPWLPEDAAQTVQEKVVEPLQNELSRRGMTYCGCLYVGLMWTDQGPKVIEFNVRLGDPEAQILAVADDRDWLRMMSLVCQGGEPASIQAAKLQPTVGVVMASAGYPYQPVAAAADIDYVKQTNSFDGEIFWASATGHGDGRVRPGAGRVFAVVSKGEGFAAARNQCYQQVAKMGWLGAQWRKDIAAKL